MKTNILIPSDANIKNTLINNEIGRNNDVYDFCLLLNSIEGNYSISIEDGWGSGKTFFVRQVKLILDELYNNNSEKQSSEEEVLRGFLNYKRSNGYKNVQSMMNVYYDAWDNDNSIDPLFSLIRCIAQSCRSEGELKGKHKFADIFKGISISFGLAGFAMAEVNPGQVINGMKADDYLSDVSKEASIREKVDEFFAILTQEKANRINIFVDELDRCRPDFAVCLLERIKHYFHHENITFIFSINPVELQHSIKHFYGAEFNATGYLDRFFDLRRPLPSINMELYYSIQGFQPYTNYNKIVDTVMRKYHFQLRQIARYLFIIRGVTPKNIFEGGFPMGATERGEAFVLTYMLPIIVGLQLFDASLYERFLSGQARNELDILLSEENQYFRLADWLLKKDVIVPEENVEIQNKLYAIYDYVFKPESQLVNREADFGTMRIDNNVRRRLQRAISNIGAFCCSHDFYRER